LIVGGASETAVPGAVSAFDSKRKSRVEHEVDGKAAPVHRRGTEFEVERLGDRARGVNRDGDRGDGRADGGLAEGTGAELHRDPAVRSVACLDEGGKIGHARVCAEGANRVIEQVAEVEPARLSRGEVGERQAVRKVLVLAERVARLAEPVGEALERVGDGFGVFALRCRLRGADHTYERDRHRQQHGKPRDIAPASLLHAPRRHALVPRSPCCPPTLQLPPNKGFQQIATV